MSEASSNRPPAGPSLSTKGVLTGLFLTVALATACARSEPEYPRELDMTTWSVVGVDPETGDVGVAVASCVQTFGDGVAALVPGKGAAATQAGFDIDNRNRVFEALQEGLTAEEVIRRVTDPEWDDQLDRRQYGVVTMHDGFVRTAGFTTPTRQGMTPGEDGTMRYAGVMADPTRGVSAQGNTLAGPEVVEWPLEAGSHAGGDVRCNQGGVRQTTSMAAILVARGGDQPYATENIGMTDAGTDKAPWLALSVQTERLAENPLLELRRQYDEWRRTIGEGGRR